MNILRLGLDEAMLRIAERNLELVSARFPKVLPVRHARAVLAHRRYLLKVPPQTLRLKPSFSFYRFRASRGFPEDFLLQAIREYEAILKDYENTGHQGLGPTVAAYALALAHNDQAAKALPWAQKAVQLSPDDWSAHNVLGIVQLKLDQPAEAVKSLTRAVGLAVPAEPKELVERAFLNASMEERAVWRYGRADAGGVWAGALQPRRGAAGHRPGPPPRLSVPTWRPTRSATGQTGSPRLPPGAGPCRPGCRAGRRHHRGDDGRRPAQEGGRRGDRHAPSPTAQVWRYKEKGFSVFLDETGRVRSMLLYAPFAGRFGPGVTLGAAPAQIEKAWGKALGPHRRRPGGLGLSGARPHLRVDQGS